MLPDNWIAYISNYKIVRSGIVRGVDLNLSIEEIYKGIKFMERPLEIKSITKLKYRDKNYNNELRDSSSIKIEFFSNLLLEFISIWSVRSRIRSFINRVRKCFNCLKWGHSSAFCRSSPVCTGCERSYNSDICVDSAFMCPDCNQIHPLFDIDCSIFQKYKVINLIMDLLQRQSIRCKKMAKIRNVTTCELRLKKISNPQHIWLGII